MRKIWFGILVAIILFNLALFAGQSSDIEKALKTVDRKKIKEYVEYLADDKLGGRAAGFEGNKTAEEYLAKHFEELKLKPAGSKETYFQGFTHKNKKVRNVLALYEGEDEKLKDEVIVIGAHFDHIGQDNEEAGHRRDPILWEKDKIWNGADDNASGTSAVMEISRAISLSGIKTKRSILFIGFNAEEDGCVGSKYYIDHKTKLKHIAMTNLDMIGRNPDEPIEISGIGTSDVWRDILKRSAKKTSLEISLRRIPDTGSDHESFLQKKIPTIFIHSGLHEEYHTIADEAKLIAFDRIANICKFVISTVIELANNPETPKWKDVSVLSPPDTTPKQLGIAVEKASDKELKNLNLGDQKGAVKITDIIKGSAGEKAGLKVGDVIIEIDDEILFRDDPEMDFLELIRLTKKGKIVVLRNGEKKELEVW